MQPKDYIKDPQRFWETYTKEEMLEKAEEQRKKVSRTRVKFVVDEVRGICPVYKEGDIALVIDSDIFEELNKDLCDRVCFGLIDNTHFRTMWTRSPRPDYDHLTTVDGEVRTCCSHPGPPYTPCGGVIFKILREELE